MRMCGSGGGRRATAGSLGEYHRCDKQLSTARLGQHHQQQQLYCESAYECAHAQQQQQQLQSTYQCAHAQQPSPAHPSQHYNTLTRHRPDVLCAQSHRSLPDGDAMTSDCCESRMACDDVTENLLNKLRCQEVTSAPVATSSYGIRTQSTDSVRCASFKPMNVRDNVSAL